MKLKKLIKDVPVKEIRGCKEIEITGLCAHSKFIAPGNLFVAKKGRREDGVDYIPEAIEAGAVAVLTDIYDPSFKHVTQIVHPQVASIEGQLAAKYYQQPSHELFMVGITGTNGKTTTSFFIKHLLEQLDGPCGLIGTIAYVIGQHQYQALQTTPDVITNHKMLREMVLQGCHSAVMEVTSHALDQARVQNIDFDVAIFTNLTLDHLDYHLTMDQYAEAKQKLFKFLNPTLIKRRSKHKTTAIVNVDSPWHLKMIQECSAQVLTYGIHHHADVTASDIALTPSGTRFILSYQDNKIPCFLPFIGRFNVSNALAAAAVGLVLQKPIDKIAAVFESMPQVSGRLEIVPNELNLHIYVDFAHTPDALKNVLETLCELKTKRIITVFGCGGDRDQSKRPKMAQMSEMFSDLTVVTSDNPRTEDPEVICQQIVKGFFQQSRYVVQLDRRRAIEYAIEHALPDDIILIAGKGHETNQVFSHQTISFDDRKVASEICYKKSKETVLSNK